MTLGPLENKFGRNKDKPEGTNIIIMSFKVLFKLLEMLDTQDRADLDSQPEIRGQKLRTIFHSCPRAHITWTTLMLLKDVKNSKSPLSQSSTNLGDQVNQI